jgi:hypothetical protein
MEVEGEEEGEESGSSCDEVYDEDREDAIFDEIGKARAQIDQGKVFLRNVVAETRSEALTVVRKQRGGIEHALQVLAQMGAL